MLITSQAFGQIYYSLESGVVDSKTLLSQDGYFLSHSNKYCFYTDIMLGYEYKNFYIENNIMSIFNKSKSFYFSPQLIKYDFKAYYKYENIRIGYEHSCTHPVLNNITDINMILLRQSHDKFFIKYELKK